MSSWFYFYFPLSKLASKSVAIGLRFCLPSARGINTSLAWSRRELNSYEIFDSKRQYGSMSLPFRLNRQQRASRETNRNENSILFLLQVLVILASRFETTRGLFWDDFVILNPGQMTRTTPSPNFHATPTGGRLATTYDLACNRPHTRRIFSGIGFRTWNPPAPKPRRYL
ncbi:hypothetical protein AVEN_106705-1 [Araneus ventricosus]|uniref:Uncharacterized protein n=1 Tax=Araneus ventricosus TaxID=182803 RepID=A0A4Y2EYV8_ARAVE|nr:hypothetical protein AVEN_106705-1 [Araneus ventricosus]